MTALARLLTLIRPDRAGGDRRSAAAPPWRACTAVAGGSSGAFGAAALTTHLASASTAGMICLCTASALCAIVAGAVAIVGGIASRSPEVRRMAAMQHLARKAETASERRIAMLLLAADNAITRGKPGMDHTALIHGVQASWKEPG